MNSRNKNRAIDKAFKVWGIATTLLGLILLAIFIGNIVVTGIERINWDFLTNLPSRRASKAGIYTAMLGSVWILVLTAIIAIPLGVASAIYLEEYSEKGRWSKILEINISNF